MKKSLGELFGWDYPMTHRELRTWDDWLDEQWNTPNRTDHYLMRLIGAVRGVLRKQEPDVPPIKFEKSKPAPKLSKEEERKQQLAMAKARWFSGLRIRKGK